MKSVLAIMSLFIGLSAGAAQLSITAADDAVSQDYGSYNFGTVWVNHRAVARWTVTNTGTTPLTYKEAYIYGRDFRAVHNCEKGLQPKEKCAFEVEYWPMFEGPSSGRFVLEFQENDQVVIDLWGQAQRM